MPCSTTTCRPATSHRTPLYAHLNTHTPPTTIAGAQALVKAFPTARHGTKRPLWARLEYNLLHPEEALAALEGEKQARGLLYDVPEIVAEQSRSGHQSNLRSGTGEPLWKGGVGCCLQGEQACCCLSLLAG